MAPGSIVRLARGDIHQDVDGTAEKVGGDGDARGIGEVGRCEPAIPAARTLVFAARIMVESVRLTWVS